jgi:hypothetical protein
MVSLQSLPLQGEVRWGHERRMSGDQTATAPLPTSPLKGGGDLIKANP